MFIHNSASRPAAACLCFAIVSTFLPAPARADKNPVTVQVTVNNTAGVPTNGIFQSTNVGDGGTSCLSSSINPCTKTHKYTSNPVNIKNLLCIGSTGSSNVSVNTTPACQKYLGLTPNCKRNNIFTSLCGFTKGKIYPTHVIPGCIFRTNGGPSAQMTWTVTPVPGNSAQVNVDCSVSGYSGATNK